MYQPGDGITGFHQKLNSASNLVLIFSGYTFHSVALCSFQKLIRVWRHQIAVRPSWIYILLTGPSGMPSIVWSRDRTSASATPGYPDTFEWICCCPCASYCYISSFYLQENTERRLFGNFYRMPRWPTNKTERKTLLIPLIRILIFPIHPPRCFIMTPTYHRMHVR